MARYFAFNTLARVSRSGTNVSETTTGGRFNSTYVPKAIDVGNGADYFELDGPFLDGSSSISTLYLRFDAYLGGNNGFNDHPIITFTNSGANAYRLVTKTSGGNNYGFQYWNGSAWVDWGSNFTISQTLKTVVISLVAGTSFSIRLDGTVAASGSSPSGAAAAITKIRFGAPQSWVASYSQIMGADYDIVSANYMTAAFNAISATNTDGTGAYTTVEEAGLDDATTIDLSTTGNKRGLTKASITVPAGKAITAAVVNARGLVSGGITDGKLGVRSGGTNYASTGRSFGASFAGRNAIWATDPATSATWTQSGFNSAEAFLEAA